MRRLVVLVAGLLLAAASPALAAPGPVCEAQWANPASGRVVPVRIRMPSGGDKAPVILFSHGLGGSLDSGRLWGEAWAEAGFAVVHLQHPGSDRSQIGGGRLMRAMSPAELAARAGDASFVLDQLGRRDRQGDCDFSRLDLGRVGMSGHSYGANTAQAMAGQRLPGDPHLADPRMRAFVAFSPSPAFRLSDQAAFGAIGAAFLSVTGSEDRVSFLPGIAPRDRERPFRAMPPGGKYLLVLEGATHMTFNGQPEVRRGETAEDERLQRAVIAVTTDFWRWSLTGDRAARRRLDAPRPELGQGDRFEAR